MQQIKDYNRLGGYMCLNVLGELKGELRDLMMGSFVEVNYQL